MQNEQNYEFIIFNIFSGSVNFTIFHAKTAKGLQSERQRESQGRVREKPFALYLKAQFQ